MPDAPRMKGMSTWLHWGHLRARRGAPQAVARTSPLGILLGEDLLSTEIWAPCVGRDLAPLRALWSSLPCPSVFPKCPRW